MYCNVVTVNCMGLLEHLRPYPSEALQSFSYDTDLINFLYTDAITGLYLSSSSNKCVSIFARTMRLVFIYRRLVLSSTHFGKRDNLKLLDSIVTGKTLVGRKYYSSRRRFAKTRGVDIFSFFQSCHAVTTK